MVYNKISAHESIIDESNERDILFLEFCKEHDGILATYLDKLEADVNLSESDGVITCS